MKIGILSRGPQLYSTQRLVEVAQQRGHEVQVINHAKCYTVMEKDSPKVYVGDHPIGALDAIIPRIGASITFYGSSIIRQFEMQGVFTTCSSLALVRSRDKLRCLQILTKSGVGIPKTAFARHPDDVDYLIKQVGGAPLIIKLLEGTQGLGVVLAETRKAAKSVMEAFMGMEVNILVQEFIAEAKAADIRAVVVDEKVVGAMKREGKEGEFRSNLHRGGRADVIKLNRAESAAAVKAAKALGLRIAGVDLLQSARGPLVIEVNSSPGLKGIEETTNIDVARKIIQYLESNINMTPLRKKDKIGV